jgi:RNA polymerase sigma factor (TIGR02999 family)
MTSEDDALPGSTEKLMESLYDALRQLAHRERVRVGRPQTLQTTALINETYVKLAHHPTWKDRPHFLATAATAMRHILVDAARARLAQKRGSGKVAESIESAFDIAGPSDSDVVRIDEALAELRGIDPRMASVVECRFFAGYSEEETAQILKVSDRTVRRDWLQAKAWLYRALQEEAER